MPTQAKNQTMQDKKMGVKKDQKSIPSRESEKKGNEFKKDPFQKKTQNERADDFENDEQ